MPKTPSTSRSTLASNKLPSSSPKSSKSSKSAKSSIPSSRSKPTTTATRPPGKQPSKRSNLSTEFVVDSDLEDDQPTSVQKSRKETTGSTKKTEAVTTPLADKRNDKDSKKKTTANNKEKSNRGLSVTPSKSAKKGQEFTAKPTEVINISSDESSDLDTEDEEKPEETSVPFQSQINGSTTAISAKNQVNGTPQDTTAGVEQDTDSEVESNSSSESNEESPSTESPAGNGTKSASEVEKSNYNNSESKSGSESDEARSEAANTPSRALARSRPPQELLQTFSSSGDIRPSLPFNPPSGFREIKEFPKSTAASSEFRSSLKGKQVWYITAPAGVSLKQLETLSLEKAGRGEAVITHDSSEYGLVADSENSKQNLKIILPGHDGYTQLRAPVDQVFHIQQITNPKLEPAPSSLSGKRKREQPQGLRMRWKPAGFISGNPGAVGDEDDSEGDIIIIEEPTRKRPQFKVLSKVPSNSPGQEKSKKRKNRDEDDLPDKNPKKTKTTKSPSSEKPTMNSKDGTISEPDSNDAAAKEISKEEEYKSKREKSSPSKHKSDSRRHESKSIKKREGKEKSKSHDITSGNIGKRQEVKEKGESRKERSSISKTKSESDTHKSKSKDRNDEKEKSKSGDKAGSEKSLENIEKKERSRDRETRSKSQSKDKAERNRDREKKKHKHVEKEKAKSEEP